MKLPTLVFAASLIAIAAATQAVRATSIDGDIKIDGKTIPNDPVGGLDSSTGFVAFGSVKVVAGTGSYADVVGNAATYFPFTYGPPPVVPVSPLWSLLGPKGTYSFDLLTMNITSQSDSLLVLDGTGTAHITGLDDTPGTWHFEANKIGQVHYEFHSDTAVPDGGLTVALLGFALAGVEGMRRKLLK